MTAVRDRVTAILTLAKAEPDLRPIVRAAISDPSRVTPRTNAPGLAAETLSEWQARAVLRRIGARTSETVWLARRLLEALDTIDRLEGKLAWHEDQMAQVPEEAWNLHGSSDPDA